MAADTRRLQRGPFRLHVVRGEPYYIDGRTLIPEARFLSFGKARATIRGHSIGGWGMGFVRVSPLAMIEETVEEVVEEATADPFDLIVPEAVVEEETPAEAVSRVRRLISARISRRAQRTPMWGP